MSFLQPLFPDSLSLDNTAILFILYDLSDQVCVFGILFSLETYVSFPWSTANFF